MSLLNSRLGESGYQWRLIPVEDVDSWNARLLLTDAHICQYPLWNDSLQTRLMHPEYVIGSRNGIDLAYVCIMRVGFFFLQFGLVRGGPVSLLPDQRLDGSIVQSFLNWARAQNYVFVFFSHDDPETLEHLARGRLTENLGRSMWGHIGDEWIVSIQRDESQVLSSFSATARRDIRKASAAGYTISSSTDMAVLDRYWPIVKAMQVRKQFRLGRSLESYRSMFEMARKAGNGRIYTVELEGRPLQVILVVRDRTVAHYVIGALDLPTLGTSPTPSCLLHWTAMQEFKGQGVDRYNLGGVNKKIAVFKSKFHPSVKTYSSLVVVLRPTFYAFSRKLYDLIMHAYRGFRAVQIWNDRRSAQSSTYQMPAA